MRVWYLLTLLSLIVFNGCADKRFTRSRADVGQFIVQQTVTRIGVLPATNNLPAIHTRWRYFEDQAGVVIRMPRAKYPEVEALLREAFGKPKLGPVDTIDGGKLGVYRLAPKGGVIQFSCDAKETRVAVIRPLTKSEFSEGMQKAMQDKRFWEGLRKDQQ